MKKTLGFYAFMFAILLSFSANAEDNPSRVSNSYNFETYWGGFKVGHMHVIDKETDKSFNLIVTIGSKGIAKLVSNYSSINIVSGIKENGKYLPKTYHSKWWRKKEAQDIELHFSRAGEVIKETLVPPERVGKRPEVEAKYKKNVVDPVTAAFVSRETIREELAKDPNSRVSFTVPTFDAKRRFDVVCEIKGYKTIDVSGEKLNLLHITMYRKPIAGFRDREIEQLRQDKQVIDFYLNEDFIPVYGVAKAAVGRATIKLVSQSSEAISDYRP